MKTVNDIFKDNPELLETKEVQELISQFKTTFNKLKTDKYKYWDKVTDLIMNSDYFLINGIPSKKVIEEIHQLSFNLKD